MIRRLLARLDSPIAISLGRVGMLAAALVSAPVVARAVGPEGRGLTASALAVIGILPVLLGLGLPMAVRRRASVDDAPPVVRTARLLVLPLFPIAIGLAWLAGTTLLRGLSSPELLVFVVAAGVSPLYVSALVDQSVLIVRKSYLKVAALQGAQPLVYVGTVLVTWFTGALDVAWVIGGQGLGMVAAGVVGASLVRTPARGSRTPVRPLVREGLTYAGSQLAETAQNRLDQVVMIPVIGAAQAGLYAVAVTVSSLPVVVGHAIGAASFKDVASASDGRRRELVVAAVRASALVGGAASIALALSAPWLVPLVFGHEFEGAVRVTVAALAAGPAIVVGYVATVLLGASAAGRDMTRAQIAGLVVGLALLVPLGSMLGALGAAVASTAGYVVTLVLALRALGVRGSDLRPARGAIHSALLLLLGRG